MNQAPNSNTWKVIRALYCLSLEIVTLANARCARLTSHVFPAGLRCYACHTWNILQPLRRPQSVSHGVPNLRHGNVREAWGTLANTRIVTTLLWKFVCFT